MSLQLVYIEIIEKLFKNQIMIIILFLKNLLLKKDIIKILITTIKIIIRIFQMILRLKLEIKKVIL